MEPIPISQLNGDAHFWQLVGEGWAPGVIGSIPIAPGVSISVGGDLGERFMIPPGHPSHPGVGVILDLLGYLPSATDQGEEGNDPFSKPGLFSLPWLLVLIVVLIVASR